MILPLWGVTALNGVPFGAKFLNDAILADIVDYDEFLTANRKEATYFMAKSFIPKVVQIPAAVLPIAFMPAVGYIQPINGAVQYQPDSVLIYIKCVSFIGVIAAGLAFVLKFKYRLTNTKLLEKSLTDIKEGREGVDPVSLRLWKPTDIDGRGEEERTVFYECSYFSIKKMTAVLAGGDVRPQLIAKCKMQLAISVGIMIGCIVGVGATIGLITHDELSFVPTLCMIGIGVNIAVNLFTYSRYNAACKLIGKLEAQDQTGNMEAAQILRQTTEETINTFLDYTNRRLQIGGNPDPDAIAPDGALVHSGFLACATGEGAPGEVAAGDGTDWGALMGGGGNDFTAPGEGERVKSIFQTELMCASL